MYEAVSGSRVPTGDRPILGTVKAGARTRRTFTESSHPAASVPRGFLLNQFTASGLEAGALREAAVVAEGSSMRRIRILVVAVVACVAALGIVSESSAGDFADDPCPLASGDNYLCPAATAGSPYALDIKLKEP